MDGDVVAKDIGAVVRCGEDGGRFSTDRGNRDEGIGRGTCMDASGGTDRG